MTDSPLGTLAMLAKGRAKRDDYQESAAHALAGCQLLEGGLKFYIDVYYTTVRRLLNGRLHFDYGRKDIEHAPLGKLVNIFSRINSNAELVERLRRVINQRDEIAHRAFAHLYGSQLTDDDFTTRAGEYINFATDITKLLSALQEEHLKVHAELEKAPK
jgi:hypothetical protein